VNGSAVDTTGNIVNTAATGTMASVAWNLTAGSPDAISLSALGAASATEAGIVTTGTQTFAGAKTFSNSVFLSPIVRGVGVVALVDGATIATDAALGNVFYVESASGRTFGIPTNPTSGQKGIWRWKNTDASAHTMTFTTAGAGAFRFGTTIAGVSATPAGRTDYIGAIYNAQDDRWDVIAYAKGYN
jgi:hypothetical protein